MNTVLNISQWAKYYGQRILETGRLNVHHSTINPPKVDLSARSESERQQILFPADPGRGFHDALRVNGGERIPISLDDLRDSRVQEFIFPTFRQIKFMAGYRRVGFLWLQTKPRYDFRPATVKDYFPDNSSQEEMQTLHYATAPSCGIDDANGRPATVSCTIDLPGSIAQALFSEIRRDLNFLHAIIHYFYYPAWGKNLLPQLLRQGSVGVIARDAHSGGAKVTETFTYTPMNLADVTF